MTAPNNSRSPCVLQLVGGLNHGGVQRGTFEMARYTVQRGWRSIVASSGGALESAIVAAGAEHHRIAAGGILPVTILRNALTLRRIIEERDVSLVHVRTRPGAWVAAIASRWTGVPFMATFHGAFGTGNALKRAYNAGLLRGCKIIAVSAYLGRHITDVYGTPQRDIVGVPRGVDPGRFTPERVSEARRVGQRATWGIRDDTPVILMPGRITRWKGQDIFIEALSRIAHVPWTAVLVGGAARSHFGDELRAKAKTRGLDGRIVFHGATDEMEVALAASDVVVSASSKPEAFGRVAVEAQAMGRPVIATAHGGSLETVRDGETGWLVPPNDPDRLAATLAAALSDSRRLRRMGAAAHAWASTEFPLERMCAGEFAVYGQVLGSRTVSSF